MESVGDVLAAVAGKQKFADPSTRRGGRACRRLRDHKCWNNDINSVQLYQGQPLGGGKAAMTITAGSDVKKFVTAGRASARSA